jgi:hypothetical protein
MSEDQKLAGVLFFNSLFNNILWLVQSIENEKKAPGPYTVTAVDAERKVLFTCVVHKSSHPITPENVPDGDITVRFPVTIRAKAPNGNSYGRKFLTLQVLEEWSEAAVAPWEGS